MFAIGMTSISWTMAPESAAAESAETLISRGLELRRQDKPTEALHVFEQAHAAEPSPRTAGNLGLTEASLGLWVNAASHLETAVIAVDDAWVQKNLAGLQQALVRARLHVGEVVVNGPEGVEVFVNGKASGRLPLSKAVLVPAGTVTVNAVGRNYEPYETTLTVVGGTHASLNLSLRSTPKSSLEAPFSPPEPIVPGPSAVPMTWKTGLGAGLLAVGVGLLAWGVVWIAIDGSSIGRGDIRDTAGKGWVLVGTGAVTAATGGVLLYVNRETGNTLAVGANARGPVFSGRF